MTEYLLFIYLQSKIIFISSEGYPRAICEVIGEQRIAELSVPDERYTHTCIERRPFHKTIKDKSATNWYLNEHRDTRNKSFER